jgi:hypothetical protein
VQDAVGEGVAWGMLVTVLFAVAPNPNPNGLQDAEKLGFALAVGVTAGLCMALDRYSGVTREQLGGRLPSRRQWRVMGLTFVLFALPPMVYLLAIGRASWPDLLAVLVAVIAIGVRVAFSGERTPR